MDPFSNDSSKNVTSRACIHVNKDTATSLQAASISLSVLILLILSFTSQRKRILRKWFWGLPGIVVPVDLLTHNPRRYISTLIFAIMSGDILKFFFNPEEFVIFNGISSCYGLVFVRTVVSPLLLVAYISIKFFPLLASVGVVIPVLGPALGLLYSVLLFSYNAYNDVFGIYCNLPDEAMKRLAIFIAVRFPVYLASLIVLLWFAWELLSSLFSVWRKSFHEVMLDKYKDIAGTTYYFSYVKYLLKRKSTDTYSVRRKRTLTYKAVRCLVPFWLSPRRLPLKFVGALTVAFFMIYEFAILLFGVLLRNFVVWNTWLKQNRAGIVDAIEHLQAFSDPEEAYEKMVELIQGIAVVVPVSFLVSMLICFGTLFHLGLTVYKNVEETAKGNFEFIKLWPTLKVSYSWRYPGYQIAFAFLGFIMYSAWLCIISILGIILYYGLKYHTTSTLCDLSYIVIPVLWVATIVIFQVAAAKLVFIKDSAGKFTELTNQRVFHWVSYFLFIYDAINGLLSSIVRIFLSHLFSLFLMIRLDRVVLMKGFEWCDIGHKAYVGFLYLNHTYNNPVVHTFIQLLSESTGIMKTSPYSIDAKSSSLNMRLLNSWDSKTYGGETKRKRVQFGPTRVRNRWLVAYTLIKNPSLRQYTASSIRHQRTATSDLAL